VIQVPPASDLPDLEIKRDGSAIRRAAWGTAMPVDPGEHMIEASAQGKLPWKQSVTVGGKSDSKTIVILRSSLPHRLASPAAAPTEASAAPPSFASGRSPAGWVAMGFGAIGLGSGATSVFRRCQAPEERRRVPQ
jgi:hypothetical protein